MAEVRVNIRFKPKTTSLQEFKINGKIGDFCRIINSPLAHTNNSILVLCNNSGTGRRELVELSPDSFEVWGDYNLENYQCETLNILEVEIK